MDFQAKKLAGFFFIDIPSGKIFTKILRMDVLMIDKTTENITFLFGFCTVEGLQFLLADQKPGDTFSQPGIFLVCAPMARKPKYQRVLVYKKPAGQGEDVTVNSYEKTNG